ncbi:hypothetical protein SUNI508_04620 [Seiridium unicorne]|uniref:Uncharacterized protein n=1 Tax=Seiridium unicorne TaxID=138068 RepID=A0ABR2V8L1_9PEZI
MEYQLSAEMPEDAKARWEVILEVAAGRNADLPDALRRQLPLFVEEIGQACFRRSYKPYLSCSYFWYYVQRKAWLAIFGNNEEADASYRGRWPWSFEEQARAMYGTPYCYQYASLWFCAREERIKAKLAPQSDQSKQRESGKGPLDSVGGLKAPLDDSGPSEQKKSRSDGAFEVGAQFPVWNNWPNALQRQRFGKEIFPARLPDKGLEHFEFPAPDYKDWPVCFGGCMMDDIEKCFYATSENLGNCLGKEKIYPLRIALRLQGQNDDGSWVGVMRFGWDTNMVDPSKTFSQVMIKLTYETIMLWYLEIVRGKPRNIATWTKGALIDMLRRPNNVWADLPLAKKKLEEERSAKVAEAEKHNAIGIEARVAMMDPERVMAISEQHDDMLHKAAAAYINEHKGDKSAEELKDWLLVWVKEGCEWGPMPFKEARLRDMRREAAQLLSKEIMAKYVRGLWADFSAAGTDVRPLRNVATGAFFDCIENTPENKWATLLDAVARGEILRNAWSELQIQAGMDYPDHEALHFQLGEMQRDLDEAIRVVTQK